MVALQELHAAAYNRVPFSRLVTVIVFGIEQYNRRKKDPEGSIAGRTTLIHPNGITLFRAHSISVVVVALITHRPGLHLVTGFIHMRSLTFLMLQVHKVYLNPHPQTHLLPQLQLHHLGRADRVLDKASYAFPVGNIELVRLVRAAPPPSLPSIHH